jgi:hemoglobin
MFRRPARPERGATATTCRHQGLGTPSAGSPRPLNFSGPRAFISTKEYTIMSTPEPKQTLYEQLGGKVAVDAAVDLFYKKVLVDQRINHFFASVDMTRQIGKQKAFLTMVFGGPVNYTGLDMRKAHAHLIERGLNDAHFDAVVENLGQTLVELGVKADLIFQIMGIAESVRNEVLNR